jgi:hypothetical protein
MASKRRSIATRTMARSFRAVFAERRIRRREPAGLDSAGEGGPAGADTAEGEGQVGPDAARGDSAGVDTAGLGHYSGNNAAGGPPLATGREEQRHAAVIQRAFRALRTHVSQLPLLSAAAHEGLEATADADEDEVRRDGFVRIRVTV